MYNYSVENGVHFASVLIKEIVGGALQSDVGTNWSNYKRTADLCRMLVERHSRL